MVDYDMTDPNDVKESRERYEKRRDRELEDIRKLLQTPEGIRFFRRFLYEGHFWNTTFRTNSSSFFLEGARNHVLKYFHDIKQVATPEQLYKLVMAEEAKEKKDAKRRH
jgi:hypothetical protein